MPSESFQGTGAPVSASGAIADNRTQEDLQALRQACMIIVKDIDAGVGLGAGGLEFVRGGSALSLLRKGLPIRDAAIMSAIEASTEQSIRVASVLERIEKMLASAVAGGVSSGQPVVQEAAPDEQFQLREPVRPEGSRRQKDEVFGKKHPLWRPVMAYATGRVRGLGKPMSAKEVADLIRTAYPQFQVDVKSVPNRLVAMGMFRVAKKGMTRPVKFWYGDGIPDGYERSS